MTWHPIFLLSSALCIAGSSNAVRNDFSGHGFGHMEKFYRAWEQKQKLSTKKKWFVRALCQRLWKENYRILCTRSVLLNLMQKVRKKKALTPKDKSFLKHACAYYKVSHWKYLINRMDIVPISMAIAQSIQECGWGRSLGCVTKNAYFGMTKGKVCYQYDSPEQSVQAYVRTLNTHRGYTQFRVKRSIMRKRQQELLGCALVNELRPYCTDPRYPKIIQHIVQKYRLSVFDLMMGTTHRSMVLHNMRHQQENAFREYCYALARRPEGITIFAQALWIGICQNFSKLFT